MSGNAQQMQQKMQGEIDELKRQLAERTGQLETASVTILERNDELANMRDQIKDLNSMHQDSVAKFEKKIKELEEELENERKNGLGGAEKLMEEIRKLK